MSMSKGRLLAKVMAWLVWLGLAVASIVSSVAYADTLSTGLVAYYPFAGDVNDTSGNNKTITVVGSASYTSANGRSGIRFDNPTGYASATNYLKVPNSTSITSLGAGSFTISICYSSTDTAKVNGRLLGNAGAN